MSLMRGQDGKLRKNTNGKLAKDSCCCCTCDPIISATTYNLTAVTDSTGASTGTGVAVNNGVDDCVWNLTFNSTGGSMSLDCDHFDTEAWVMAFFTPGGDHLAYRKVYGSGSPAGIWNYYPSQSSVTGGGTPSATLTVS